MNRRKFSALLPASVALAGCQSNSPQSSSTGPTTLEFSEFYKLMWNQVDYSAAKAAERLRLTYRWDTKQDCLDKYESMDTGNGLWHSFLVGNYGTDAAAGKDPREIEWMPYFSHAYFQCAKLAGKKSVIFACEAQKERNREAGRDEVCDEELVIDEVIFEKALRHTHQVMAQIVIRQMEDGSEREVQAFFNACG